MIPLMVNKKELKLWIKETEASLLSEDFPGSLDDKQRALGFIKEFLKAIEDSQQGESLPLGEVLALLTLEATSGKAQLEKKVKEYSKLSQIATEIRELLPENQHLKSLIKVFDFQKRKIGS